MSVDGYWNKTHLTLSEIKIYILTAKMYDFEDGDKQSGYRLFVLSNILSKRKIPSFYVRETLSLGDIKTNKESTICFDIFDEFNKISIPGGFAIESVNQFVNENIPGIILRYFQKAYNLYFFYSILHMNPIYFNTFVFLSSLNNSLSNIIIKNVIAYSDSGIVIRPFIKELPNSILYKDILPDCGSIILFPPYEHPFYVNDVFFDYVSLISLDKKPYSFYLSKSQLIKLYKPPNCLFNFSENTSVRLTASRENYIEEKVDIIKTNSGDISLEKEIHDFFFPSVEESLENNKYDEVHYKDVTLSGTIDELVDDKDLASVILRISNYSETICDINVCLSLNCSINLACLEFDIAPPVGVLNYFCKECTLDFFSNINGVHTGVPNVSLSSATQNTYTIAVDKLFESWIEKQLIPESGFMYGYYAIFIVDECQTEDYAKLFVRDVCNSYRLHNLGIINKFEEKEMIFNCSTFDFDEMMKNFAVENKDADFIIFVFHPYLFDIAHFDNYSIIYISETVGYTSDVIYKTAFLAYSKLNSENKKYQETCSFNMNFSYLFYIETNNQKPYIHCCWDPDTGYSAWLNDSGNAFYVYDSMDLSQVISTFQKIPNNNNYCFTFAVLGEGITNTMYNEVLSKDIDNFNLISVFPSPGCQADFKEKYSDDIIVFSHNERMFDTGVSGFIKPLASAFVIPHKLLSYSVSVYYHSQTSDNEALTDIIKSYSYLSWLSCSYESPGRLSAIPLHVLALIEKANKNTELLRVLEFLPSRIV